MKQKFNKKTIAIEDTSLRLVSKKTGKFASSTNWLVDLAAVAKKLGDSSGIAALLPQEKAGKLLLHNELKPFKRQKEKTAALGHETLHKELRDLARSAYPELALFYIENVVHSKKSSQVNKKGFRAWLIQELSRPMGELNQHLQSIQEFHPLIELNRSDDWWRKCLKTESKSKVKS